MSGRHGWHLPREIWIKLWKREEGKCLCCGKPLNVGRKPSPHHLLPRYLGGKDTADNLVLVCIACHDMIEMAQEANVLGLNKPLQRNQLTGIFADQNNENNEEASQMITPIIQKNHANRLINSVPANRLSILHQTARRLNLWQHVDWAAVERFLKSEKAADGLSTEPEELAPAVGF